MFNPCLHLTQIKQAHSKVKSGADFPNYVQDLINLDVTSYETFVSDGHTVYYGNNGFNILSDAKYSKLEIAEVSNKKEFQNDLKAHQQGKTNYPTFCADCAKSGIEKVDSKYDKYVLHILRQNGKWDISRNYSNIK